MEPDLNQKQITLSDTKEVLCECGHGIFLAALRVRTVSKLLTGKDRDGVLPIETLVCQKCGKELPAITG